jgi:hypothetical protein
MKIELTDQQAQAVKNGQTVEVLDPLTAQAYILLARDQYERVRPLLESSRENPPPPPTPPAAPSPAERGPERVRLRDLPTPAEVVEEAEHYCRKYGWGGERNRREVEEQLKLQYYYGGQAVYILPTPEGPVVIPIAGRYKDMPDLRYVLLQPEERSRASYTVPSRWRDSVSEILSS